jgi:hypothetical protein
MANTITTASGGIGASVAGPAVAVPIPIFKMAVMLTVTVLTAWFATYRIAHAGDWLPTLPDRVGIWQATETPMPTEMLKLLGGPQALGREYNNLFNEPIQVSVIATNSFDAYHDPTVCVTGNGFTLTGAKVFKIDGPGSGDVRAMIFKHNSTDRGDIRMLMYYWQQSNDGVTGTDPIMGSYRDMIPRFKTGAAAVFKGRKTCLVRIYAPIGQQDPYGEQTQRNVHKVSQAIYRAMKKSGAED